MNSGYAQIIESAGAKLISITDDRGRIVVAFRAGDGAPVRLYASAVTVENVRLALKDSCERSRAAMWEMTV
jgi:hypothetical protein